MRFEEYLLEDVLDIKYGKNQKKVKDDNGPYPILGTGGLMGYATEYLYDKPSVLIGRKGSISKVRYIDEPFWTVDTLFYTIVNEEIVYPKFIYYYLSQIDFNYYNEGTTIPSLRTQTLNQIILNLPDLKYQAKILKMVNPIEERIELNNSIISNLEELAQTLFKRWFVDFEFPNEEGKPYKSSDGKMVESELGMIPEGWGVKSLSEIANFQNGLAMQKFRPGEGEDSLPVLKIKELRQGFTDYNSDLCSTNIKDSVKVYDGDVIFSWSATLLVKLWVGGNAGLNQHLFKVTSEEHSKWFYYLWTKHYLDLFNAIAKDKATTMGHIKRSHLDESKVIVPSKQHYIYFDSVFNRIIEQKINLLKENKSLIGLRDTLLPKLLSGEIKLPDDMEVTDDVPIS